MPAFNRTDIEVIDLPPEPAGLTATLGRSPVDGTSLAHSLGMRNRTLMYLITNREKQYKVHRIPKKSGGMRVIHAPDKMLKFAQTRVLDRYLTPLDYPEHIAAYVPGRTTRASAEKHAGKPLLIVIDLKDFFPSTRRSWVRKVLQQEFSYSHRVAGYLADLMTVRMDFPYGARYVVPQGAPTSGAICNWVAHHRIDRAILDLCSAAGMTYTRYADDLAFSHSEKLDKKTTNKFIKEVCKVIADAGYTVNRKKLRVARAGRQQRLLGMTVNEKPNIMRLQYRNMRARIHHCKYDGFTAVAQAMRLASADKLKSQIEGQISYFHMINPDKAAKLKASYLEACAAPPNQE